MFLNNRLKALKPSDDLRYFLRINPFWFFRLLPLPFLILREAILKPISPHFANCWGGRGRVCMLAIEDRIRTIFKSLCSWSLPCLVKLILRARPFAGLSFVKMDFRA